jgi:hypothetical protein
MLHVLDELKAFFVDEVEYFLSIKEYQQNYKDVFKTELDLTQNDRKLSSNRLKLTEYCKIKIFVYQNLLMFCIWLLLTLVFTYYLIREIREKRNFYIAEKMYKCIVLDIQKNNKVTPLYLVF